VGADGRNSRVRECAGLTVENVGASMDSLQFRLSRRADDPQLFVYSNRGKTMVTVDRGDYWHCGFAIPKGAGEKMQAIGIEVLRAGIVEVAPFLSDRVKELREWNNVKLLTVRADRLRQWYRPGLICIGDAAHAMSPVGGVGINLAIQDAVAAANILAEPLRGSALSPHASRSACKGSSRSKSGVASTNPNPRALPGPSGCWNAPRSRAGCAHASSPSVSAPST
jgi:2-polyprenyl-6-methoxyphenol hydroxylase-like FAD-dependent oxidoreductase